MLNDAQLRAAQPKEKPYKLFDAHQLYLFVTPKGAKVWRMNFKYDGKEKSLSIGPYPSLDSWPPARSATSSR